MRREPLDPLDLRRRVRLFEADVGLFEDVPMPARIEAAQRLTVPAAHVRAAEWPEQLDVGANAPGALGLLVLEGVIGRLVHLGAQRSAELLGPGDVIGPATRIPSSLLAPRARLTVLQPAWIAVLDPSFARLAGRWPTLLATLSARARMRSERLALQLTISAVRPMEERILVFFWHLADRWGVVTRAGVRLELRCLTHDLIARLVGASRQRVSTAVGELTARGQLDRDAHQRWLLPGDPDAPPFPAPAAPGE
jgi:hypothetical protein